MDFRDDFLVVIATPEPAQYWVKVVGMLQENWAVVLQNIGACEVVFFHSNGYNEIFDRVEIADVGEGEQLLRRFGFSRYLGDAEALRFLGLPDGPFTDFSRRAVYSTAKVIEDAAALTSQADDHVAALSGYLRGMVGHLSPTKRDGGFSANLKRAVELLEAGTPPTRLADEVRATFQ